MRLLKLNLKTMIAKSTLLIYTTVLLFIIGACGSPISNPNSETQVPELKTKTKTWPIVPILIAGTTEAIREFKNYREYKKLDSAVIDSVGPMTPIQQVMEKLAPPTQTFSVTTNRDTLITCDQGTMVYLPANTFDTKGEQVKVSVQEFYSYSDYISRDLSTMSAGRLLESAGTVKITAIGDEGWLEVKEGESYEILFPKKVDGSMEIFYGQRDTNGIMDWVTAAELKESDSIRAENISPKGALENREPLTDNESSTDDLIKYTIWMSDFYRPKLRFEECWRLIGDDRNLTQYFNEEFNGLEPQAPDYETYSPGANRQEEYIEEHLWYNVYFDDQGKVSAIQHEDWRFISENARPTFTYKLPSARKSEHDSSVMAFLFNMPPVDMETINLKMGGKFKMVFVVQGNISDQFKQQFLKKNEQYRESVIKKMPIAELNYFILASSEMGWINCDRFYQDNGDRVKLEVQAPGRGQTKYYMIFNEFNAVIPGSVIASNSCIFNGVPEGQSVKIVALSFEGQTPLLSVKDIVPSGEIIRMTGFVPFTLSDLQALINFSD